MTPKLLGSGGRTDTEEVASSIPVPPTSTKWPLTCGNVGQGLFTSESSSVPWSLPTCSRVRETAAYVPQENLDVVPANAGGKDT